MTMLTHPAVRQHVAALRTLLVLTIAVGIAYPLALTAVAQVAFPGNADGSLVRRGGQVVGSDLVGQSFDGKGTAYFQSRPSAAGDGYDPLSTSASNLGPESPELVAAVKQRRAEVARREGVDVSAVPPDAVLSSGSGLDPHISPAYAALQVRRVARERGLSVGAVRALVAAATESRTLGILGEPRVNVLRLNLALDAAAR